MELGGTNRENRGWLLVSNEVSQWLQGSLPGAEEGGVWAAEEAKGHFLCDKEEEAHSQSQNLGSREISTSISGQVPPLCFAYRETARPTSTSFPTSSLVTAHSLATGASTQFTHSVSNSTPVPGAKVAPCGVIERLELLPFPPVLH